MAAAAVAVAGLAVVGLAANMAVDRWLDLSRAHRAALLVVDGIGLLAVLVWRGVLPVVRGPDVEQAALWVERAVPAFGSRLISAVQFSAGGAGAGASAAMVRALVRQVEAEAAGVDFATVVPSRPVKRLATVTGVVVGVIGVAVVAGGRTSLAFAERAVLVPGVAYPHRTRVTVLGGDVTVARGDPVTLSATAAGDVPAAGRVVVRQASGATAEVPVDGVGDRFDRSIENVQEPFAYRFAIGDDKSAERHVRVATRPAVLGVRCRVTPPAYTGVAAGERSPWDLSLLAGSKLGLAVTANVPAAGRVVFAGAGGEVPLAGDGVSLSTADVEVPAGATGFSVELTSAEGLRSRDAVVYRLDTVADRPPTVRLTVPATDGTVTPVARPTLAVEADDDYGVARLSLRYRVTKAGQTTAADDDPNGLVATYGDGAAAGVTRVDADVNFNWAATPPPAGVGEPFGARWAGTVRPTVSDDYWFTAKVTGGCVLRVAGKTLIDRPGQTDAGPVHLQAGRLYPIELTTAGATHDGEARLSWRGRRVAPRVVPHSCLFRRADAVEPAADVGGLVGYWPLDDAGGGVVHDAAGTADGTVFDAVAGGGRIGGGIVFRVGDGRGFNSHVEVPESSLMQYRADESFALMAWASSARVTGKWQGVVTRGKDGGGFYGLWVDPAGRWAAAGPGGNLVGPAASPGWHHLAVVQDGPAGRRTLFVDGVAAVSGKAAAGDGWGPLVMGNVRTGAEPFEGSVDDVRLYARAVPDGQVRATYAEARAARVPTAAEVGGVSGGGATAVPLDVPRGVASRHVERSIRWALAALPTPPAVGDAVDVWFEAADGNTVTGPGTAVSEHRHFRVVDEGEKPAGADDQVGRLPRAGEGRVGRPAGPDGGSGYAGGANDAGRGR